MATLAWVVGIVVGVILVGRMMAQEADWSDPEHEDRWPYAPRGFDDYEE